MRIDLRATGRQAIGNRVLGKFRSEASWPRPNLISEEKAVLEGVLKSGSIYPIGGAVSFRILRSLKVEQETLRVFCADYNYKKHTDSRPAGSHQVVPNSELLRIFAVLPKTRKHTPAYRHNRNPRREKGSANL
jgi:hypothetical protein